MGNRAIIKTETGHVGMYLHWNGGRDSVEAFLRYCDLRGFRSPETDGYGWARLAQVIGNFFGGGLSLGMVEVNAGGLDGIGCNNGAYVIKDWQIIKRENFEGREQMGYDMQELLLSIDEAQPEKDRIGEYLRGREIPTAELKAGDEIILPLWSGEMKRCTVLGFGSARYVNGHMVEGVPFVDAYNRGTGAEAYNPNNYITTDTVRLAPADTTAEEPEKENPVEIFVNDALNGIELKFSRKPDEQTREALKSSGWRWHRKRCVWYTKNNTGNMEMAKRIAAAVTE